MAVEGLAQKDHDTAGPFGRLTAATSEFANKRGIYLGRRSNRIYVWLYRRSGGRIGGHLPGWPQARVLLLNHTGAQTGRRRASPVMYHEDGRILAIAASKGGQPTNPAWLYNLRAHPETTVEIGAEVRPVRARVATDQDRERLWPRFVAFYPGYEFFQRNAGGRRIPLVILERRSDPSTER